MPEQLIKHGDHIKITVQDVKKQRIDHFLHQQFPTYSRSFFQRAIENNQVTVNQKSITKTGYSLKAGDIIEIKFPSARSVSKEMVATDNLGIEIVYEHPHFLIINKPAGLLVHPINTTKNEVTLADWIAHNIDNISHVGYIDRPGIVHRLDKYTSGLMIIARTSYGYAQFGTLFRNRSIKKIYYAIVKGHPPQKGTIDLPIGRHPIERTKMKAFTATQSTSSDKLRHAITDYETERYFKDTALVKVSLQTGRTHQIRVHFATIGYPLVGDIVYGTASTALHRQALHAHQLEFIFDKQLYSFQAKLPADMKKLIAHIAAEAV